MDFDESYNAEDYSMVSPPLLFLWEEGRRMQTCSV